MTAPLPAQSGSLESGSASMSAAAVQGARASWVDTGSGLALLSSMLFLKEVDFLSGDYGEDKAAELSRTQTIV